MENTDYGQTGDIALDNLLQETQQQIQETYDFILPDTMVHDAIEHACTFFNLPEVPVVDSTGVCVWPNTPGTPFDDVFGFDRAQMMEMGIQGEDALTLVYTHECAHRALQDWEGIDGKKASTGRPRNWHAIISPASTPRSGIWT